MAESQLQRFEDPDPEVVFGGGDKAAVFDGLPEPRHRPPLNLLLFETGRVDRDLGG